MKKTATQELHDRLSDAAEKEGDLDSWTEAIDAVLDFLDSQGFEAAPRIPLLSLLGALKDLPRGVQHPSLERPPERRTWNRPPVAAEFELKMACAAAEMDRLMQLPKEQRKSRTEAAKIVVQTLEEQEVKLPLARDSEPWKYVANWRDRIRNGRVCQETTAFYNRLIQWREASA